MPTCVLLVGALPQTFMRFTLACASKCKSNDPCFTTQNPRALMMPQKRFFLALLRRNVLCGRDACRCMRTTQRSHTRRGGFRSHAHGRYASTKSSHEQYIYDFCQSYQQVGARCGTSQSLEPDHPYTIGACILPPSLPRFTRCAQTTLSATQVSI